MTSDADEKWFWGRYAPDEWFSDRASGSILVRGYLALQVGAVTSGNGLMVDSGHFAKSQVLVSWMRGRLDVPPPMSFHYVGGDTLAVHRADQSTQLPHGTYAVIMVPIAARVREVDEEMERDASAQIDTAAGAVAAFVSPNAIYQLAFEFLSAAHEPETRVMSLPLRAPGESVLLNNEAFVALSKPLNGIEDASESLRRRARTSLRWYAQAQAERNRPDAFVKFWVALEALAFSGSGKPRPLIELLAAHYAHDDRWVRETFGINELVQLRGYIVHSGQRPMLHGNLLRFIDALYVDALQAKLRLPNERRAERALPEGVPLNVARWRDSGSIDTAYLPESGPKQQTLGPTRI